MAYRCEVCGKEPWVGKQVSFSHKRSSRRWLPNIQKVRVKHGSNSRQGQRIVFEIEQREGADYAHRIRFGSDGY